MSGVDIWMNTPTRPLEASGTSGEKAEMNGVVNLSVLDGWWVEGYRQGAGWALKQERTYENQGYQDQLDAATIYNMLENEIVPLYYDKDENGMSKNWIKVIKNSIATIAPHYTMKRQLDDYYSKFYCKLAERSAKINANGYQLAKEIAQWKESVAERWDAIHVVSEETSVFSTGAETGKNFKLQYVIDEQGLNDVVGLELVSLENEQDGGDRSIHRKDEFKMVKHEGNLYTFELEVEALHAGCYRTAVRMFPKSENLPHRQDFCYIKWLD